MLGNVLIELADVANCVNGDYHTMHLNVRGMGFDVAHAFLKTYYEQAADDYDRWAEAALMYVDVIPNPNSSASRIKWQSLDAKVMHYEDVLSRVDVLLSAYVEALCIALRACDEAPGVANALQTRVEYWDKERLFFNARRSV